MWGHLGKNYRGERQREDYLPCQPCSKSICLVNSGSSETGGSEVAFRRVNDLNGGQYNILFLLEENKLDDSYFCLNHSASASRHLLLLHPLANHKLISRWRCKAKDFEHKTEWELL
jgi:hypothetical protein